MNELLFTTLKNKDFIVKKYLFKIVNDLNLNEVDMMLLIYFMNQEIPTLDVENMSKTLYLDDKKILESFSKLCELKVISVELTKKGNVTTEVISLDNMLKYVTSNIVKNKNKNDSKELFLEFEREFGRTISPMEYEIVNGWIKEGFSIELIECALKEAIYHGAKNFKYIYTILISWKEKGYKTKNDINNGIKKETIDNKKENLFEYDWVNDEE